MLTYSATSDTAVPARNMIRNFQEKGFAFEMVGVGVIGRELIAKRIRAGCGVDLIAASAALTCGIPFAEVLEALNHISMAYFQKG